MRLVRPLLIGGSIGALLVLALMMVAHIARDATDAFGQAYTIDDLDKLPPIDTALVLGSAPLNRWGMLARTLGRRLDTAAGLWHTARVGKLIVSGIRVGPDYDEAKFMRDELIARGIPPAAIEQDSAGNRTWDSVVRARYVYGRQRLIIVTQRDHLARALFLARHAGIDAWGVAAPGGTYNGFTANRMGDLVSLYAYVDAMRGPAARALAAGRSF